jgi:hypothetical protein
MLLYLRQSPCLYEALIEPYTRLYEAFSYICLTASEVRDKDTHSEVRDKDTKESPVSDLRTLKSQLRKSETRT